MTVIIIKQYQLTEFIVLFGFNLLPISPVSILSQNQEIKTVSKIRFRKKIFGISMQTVDIPSSQNIFQFCFEYKNSNFFLKASIIGSSGLPLRYPIQKFSFLVTAIDH